MPVFNFMSRSQLNRLNFRGFYTVLLERNDELITVAILRYVLLLLTPNQSYFVSWIFNTFLSLNSIFSRGGCMVTKWQKFHSLVPALSIAGLECVELLCKRLRRYPCLLVCCFLLKWDTWYIMHFQTVTSYSPIYFFFTQNLIKLGVTRLVLPAAASVLNTWTSAFGFTPVSNTERLEFLSYSFLDFQDTVMCQKRLGKLPFPLPHLSRDTSGMQLISFWLIKQDSD